MYRSSEFFTSMDNEIKLKVRPLVYDSFIKPPPLK